MTDREHLAPILAFETRLSMACPGIRRGVDVHLAGAAKPGVPALAKTAEPAGVRRAGQR